jgi:hypothetical protein
MSAIVGIAQVSSARNGIRSTPRPLMISLPIPSWVSRIQSQTRPATTFDIRYGVSTMPRSIADRVSRWSRTAVASAATVWTPMLMTTYSTVTHRESQKMGSLTMRT